ncbi:coiled-coil protein [Salmonella enterica subsp. enterica serovar Typhi]|nr:coiled-coil protein [Salmonella enterica subsp. enterica serovar Typhi]CIM99397.1 coiled-coil protein [Salmonella enterica subsp. enterica serovar Typhi]
MDYATYLAFLEHFGRNEETFQKILINKELLKTLLDNFNNIEKEVWVYDTDLKSFTTREVDLLDYDLPSAIGTLLGKVEGAIYAQRSTQLSATLLGIDPVIYSNHMFLHEWTTEQLVKDYGKLNPLSSEEQAITMGLSAAEVKFLTALSDLELKKIRERGQLESLRHELRISRHDLQGKRVQDKRVQINRIRAASRQGRDQTYGPEVF